MESEHFRSQRKKEMKSQRTTNSKPKIKIYFINEKRNTFFFSINCYRLWNCICVPMNSLLLSHFYQLQQKKERCSWRTVTWSEYYFRDVGAWQALTLCQFSPNVHGKKTVDIISSYSCRRFADKKHCSSTFCLWNS